MRHIQEVSDVLSQCPKCGGDSETLESAEFSQISQAAGRVLHWLALHGHRHPILSAGRLAATVGHEAYKRAPGGGAKRCTKCGHHFN